MPPSMVLSVAMIFAVLLVGGGSVANGSLWSSQKNVSKFEEHELQQQLPICMAVTQTQIRIATNSILYINTGSVEFQYFC